MEKEKNQLWDLEVYTGNIRLGLITVTAKTPEEASNVAIKDINVKIKRAYS